MFDPHGRFRVVVHGDVLVIDGWGPWDQQTATAYAKAVAAAVETIQPPWACLVRFHAEPLMWGDTRDHIRDAVRLRVARGMQAMAVVMADQPAASIVREQYGALYRECGAAFAFFHDDPAALAWLQDQGYARSGDAVADAPDGGP